MSSYQIINLLLLITHGLVSVALLGAISHQCVAVVRAQCLPAHDRPAKGHFLRRYAAVGSQHFVGAVVLCYLLTGVLGAVLYPEYRLESRYALEELRLLPVVGLFELKEHFAGLGLGLLPLYVLQWRQYQGSSNEPPMKPPMGRTSASPVAVTLTLGFIVWFTFIVGHVVNNYRGL